MPSYPCPNPVLQEVVDRLGGPFAVAEILWPGLRRRTGYDRVYQWLRRGRVCDARALGPLARAAREAGLAVTDDVISALGGTVARPLTTECRTASTQVKYDQRAGCRDAA